MEQRSSRRRCGSAVRTPSLATESCGAPSLNTSSTGRRRLERSWSRSPLRSRTPSEPIGTTPSQIPHSNYSAHIPVTELNLQFFFKVVYLFLSC
uniref:Uncharacterized protein n=1 Tax=Anguilla anguilla TaxID=7936 RepID=A0A0E9WX56_ANGAN